MKRAQRRKYHCIYKTTCIITNRFYIGMHSTDNLNDGYIGSGKRLWYSINKHGIENHVYQILELLESRDSLIRREREIVDGELLENELCMNLQLGGGGGFSNDEHKRKAQESGRKSYIERLKNDKDFLKKISDLVSIRSKGNQYGIGNKSFLGKSHTEETKELMRLKAKERTGDKNSQFGTCWITNGIESKKIIKGNIVPEGWKLGRKITSKNLP